MYVEITGGRAIAPMNFRRLLVSQPQDGRRLDGEGLNPGAFIEPRFFGCAIAVQSEIVGREVLVVGIVVHVVFVQRKPMAEPLRGF